MARRPSQDDVMRLGPELAAIKASTPRRRWRRLVKDAHKRGYTVRGALSNVPDPLRERTQESLRKQAAKTIADAYKPAEAELGQQESRIRALDDKRQRDNAAYREWLNVELGKINAQARAADQALSDRMQAVQNDTAQSWFNTQQGARQAAAATPGNVSNPDQSTALDFSAAARQSVERVANARTQQAANAAIGEQERSRGQAALIAQQAAAEAKRVADTWSALAEVGDDRQKLQLQKAADAAKEVQDLLDKEVEKAQWGMEFGAAAEKLGLDQQKFQYTQQKDAKEYKLKKQKLTLDQWIAKNKSKVEQAKLELGYDKLAQERGQKAADRALRLRLEKMRSRRSNSADSRRASQQFETIETVRGQIEDLHTRFRAGKTRMGKTFRQVLRERGYSDPVIDVAEDLRRHNGKLSKRGRAKAQALGIADPTSYWG